MKYLTNARAWVIASFAVFWILLMAGWTWWDRQTPQAQYHMLGTLAYRTVNYELANEYFDKSFADFQSRTSNASQGSKSYFEAPGSLEMAQLSLHLKALGLIKMKDGKMAVLTFKEALKLTSDQALSKVANLDPATLDKLKEDRRAIQINLEILFQQQPQMAKQEGKGKGGKPGEGKQSEDPSKSGPNAGKMDRNAL